MAENTTAQRIWGTLHPFFEGGAILGRTVANAEFLRALLREDPFDAYHFFLPGQNLATDVHTKLKAEFPAIEQRGGFLCATRHELPHALQERRYHCFHLSDSVTGQAFLSRLRNALAPELFPVTGITHSLSYSNYMGKFLEHLWPGACGRDAVVATSSAGQSVVLNYFTLLRSRYGLDEAAFPAPRVPIIPLGIHPMFRPGAGEYRSLRAQARERLGAGEGEPVFLAFARLSHYSKMDLMPLFYALQGAETLGLPRGGYTLVIAGQEAPGESLPGQIRAMAANAGIRLRIEASPDDVLKRELFAAADVFVSPSDNIQETFGLTMIEAAAAGLPVIASDYDGYRDIVVNNETGLLVPTTAPAATPEQNLLAVLAGDGQSHLELAQQTVVDVPALAKALAHLGANAAARAEMGAKALARCAENYFWPVVIKRWLNLWDEMGKAPVDVEKLRSVPHPLEPDFGALFAAYPSTLLSDATAEQLRVRQSRRGSAVYRKQDFPVLYSDIEAHVPLSALRRLLVAARKEISIAELRAQLRNENLSAEAADFLILWACKQDLLEFSSSNTPSSASLPDR